MRDPERIPDVLKRIEIAWKARPDWRLAQLLTVIIKPTQPVPEIFYEEDDTLIRKLNEFEKGERQ